MRTAPRQGGLSYATASLTVCKNCSLSTPLHYPLHVYDSADHYPFASGEFAPRLELVCPEALDLVWQLTRKDPNLRLSARAALCHSLLG
jgi:hypothetical protein